MPHWKDHLTDLFDFSSPTTSLPFRSITPLLIILSYLFLHLPFPSFIRAPFDRFNDFFEDKASVACLARPLIANDKPKRWQWPCWKQTVCAALAFGEVVFWFAKTILLVPRTKEWQFYHSVATVITWSFLAILPFAKPTRRVPQLPLFLYLLLGGFSIISLCSAFLERIESEVLPVWATARFYIEESVHASVTAVLIAIIISMPIIDPEDVERLGDNATIEEHVTLWQWWTWRWINPLVKLGTEGTIKDEEVPLYTVTQRALVSCDIFQSLTGGPLSRMLRMHARDIFRHYGCATAYAIIQILHIYFIKVTIEGLEEGTSLGRSRAFKNSAFFLLSRVIEDAFMSCYRWSCNRWTMKVRGILSIAIYKKILSRKNICVIQGDEQAGKSVNKPADLGKIQSLLTGDLEQVYNQANRSWWLLRSPITIVIATGMLCQALGPSALVAVVMFSTSAPIATYFSNQIMKYRKVFSEATDKRLSIMNELITHVKNIKLFGWCSQWASRVELRRATEIDSLWLKVLSDLRFYFATAALAPFASALTLTCFVYVAGGELSISLAFTSLMLFDQVGMAMKTLPEALVDAASSWVAWKRMVAFLDEDDLMSPDDEATSVMGETKRDLGFKGATLRWNSMNSCSESKAAEPETEAALVPKTFLLRDLNVIFPQGKLTLVTGPTSCGKSALLLGLFGEMTCVQGEVLRSRAGVAYCGQRSWLQHMTIRDNILFGSPMDEDRFNEVIYECSLAHDLEVLEDGLDTEVGVGGKTLSGGQQARISLARAVYSHCPVVLLDDPLSACDSHTCLKLVERCLMGPLLAGRTCILVSHHVELVTPAVDFLVRMRDGRIEERCHLKKTGKGKELAKMTTKKQKRDRPLVAPATLIDKEARVEGQVSWQTYRFYLSANPWYTWIASATLLSLGELSKFFERMWLIVWAGAYIDHQPITTSVITFPNANTHPGYYAGVYAAIMMLVMTFGLLQNANAYYGGLKASKQVHRDLVQSVLGSTIRFFDVTPAGRICNRFATDMQKIDDKLPLGLRSTQWYAAICIGAIATTCYFLPWFLPLIILLLVLYYDTCRKYTLSIQDLKRIRATKYSHLLQIFDETMEGITVLRAFKVQERMFTTLCQRLDESQTAEYWMATMNRWQMVRLNYTSLAMVAGIIFLNLSGRVSAGVAGVTLSSVITLSNIVFNLSREAAYMMQTMDSVERVREYCLEIPQEPPAILDDHRPPAYWPSGDESRPLLEIKDLHVRYSPELPDVLHGISIEIRKGEKIGLCGVTGSGKSSLSMALLRFIDPSQGSIVYDGIDITTIGVEDLRQKITYIPQAPCLFSGTLRKNLDIFSEFTDEEMLEVIDKVEINRLGDKLKEIEPLIDLETSSDSGSHTAVESIDTALKIFKFDLETEIAQDGKNLSAGQAQLIAMARAMLTRKKLVIADEPTSNIDLATDMLIQKAMRTQFKDSTLLVVAHRISSVIDYDRLLVLEDGKVAEFDTPMNLLRNADSHFKAMCLHSGKHAELYAAAEAAEKAKMGSLL